MRSEVIDLTGGDSNHSGPEPLYIDGEPPNVIEALTGKGFRTVVEVVECQETLRNRLHYKVKWEGYSEETWEPRTTLDKQVPELVAQYEQYCRTKTKAMKDQEEGTKCKPSGAPRPSTPPCGTREGSVFHYGLITPSATPFDKAEISSQRHQFTQPFSPTTLLTEEIVYQRPPKNDWLNFPYEKEALCVLRRWYTNSWSDFTKLFNCQFATELANCLLVNGLREVVVRSQWHEINSLRDFDPSWRAVFEVTFADEENRWQETRESLEKTAQEIGLNLRRRIEENIEKPPNYSAVREKRRRTMGASRLVTPGEGRKNTFKTKLTNSIGRSLGTRRNYWDFGSQRTGGIALKSGQMSEGNTNMPSIVFRFFDNSSSGLNARSRLRAGQFENRSAFIPDPPRMDSDGFKEQAHEHLRIKIPVEMVERQKGMLKTPFISLYERLLPTLYRALQSSKKPCIVIVDLHKINCKGKVYSAAHLIKKLDADSKGAWAIANRYKGRSEWLVYGEIDSDAIIGFCTLDQHIRRMVGFQDMHLLLRLDDIQASYHMSHVRAQLKSDRLGNSAAAGHAIGRLAKVFLVSKKHVAHVVAIIIKDWEISKGLKWQDHMRFLTSIAQAITSTADFDDGILPRAGQSQRLIADLQKVVRYNNNKWFMQRKRKRS
ncbi:MAG: hypothetical protein M1827_002056 [Pycnora praestabilis]|nr:MAG: hypothetical protein M1827_002056 [Pycnora praestabilis]